MVSCSSSASRSPSRRSLGTCAATRGHRLRAGGRFSAITSTASRRSTSLSCRRSHSKFCIVLRHGRRLWVSFGVTANPTAEWISRQVTEAFPWDHAPRDLIRDRDTSYGPVFLQRIRVEAKVTRWNLLAGPAATVAELHLPTLRKSERYC